MARPNQTQMAMYKKIAQLEKAIKDDVPSIYACFVKVFIDKGWTAEMIQEVFIETQKLWQENVDNMDSMINWVEKETGINVRWGSYEEATEKE